MRYQSKQAVLDAIRSEHDHLCRQLDAIPAAQYRAAGAWGVGWTVKDLVAHLAEWQRMFLRWYDDGLKGNLPDLPARGYSWRETPQLNRAIWAKHRRRSIVSVREDFEAGYQRILAIVERLPPDALLRSGAFSWTGTHPLTTYLGANSASHYRFATKVLKRWARRESTAPTRRG